MFISTIIPTIGRSTLSRAVYSVLKQDFRQEECEVIVVNDSGRDLPLEDWQQHANVRVIATNRRNRSIARNTGASIATGRYFHFLDDDDWMLPGAFEAFWETTNNSSAAWIHGAFRMVDSAGKKIVDIFPEEKGNCYVNLMSWEWLPLQASIVEARVFHKLGGFARLESLKGGFEDIDLTRHIALEHDFMNISKLLAVIRSGDQGSTTNYTDMFVQNRQSRESNLDLPGSYQRLFSSARDNPTSKGYWYGKAVHYLLVSAILNFRSGRYAVSTRRVFHAVAGTVAAGKHLLQSDFWNAVIKPHHSRVKRALESSGKAPYQNTQWNKGL
jgi:glycosyltransferase involved in cell wall biosynthesis